MQVVIRNEVIYLNFSNDGKRHRKSTGLKATKQNIKHVQEVTIPELLLQMQSIK